MVARAWVDAAYKERLLANGTKACEELGIEVPALKLLVVVPLLLLALRQVRVLTSSAPFVAAVRPRVALVSVGARNTYGHPNGDVIRRLYLERGWTQRAWTWHRSGS